MAIRIFSALGIFGGGKIFKDTYNNHYHAWVEDIKIMVNYLARGSDNEGSG